MSLPEKLASESNDEWCKRAAGTIPPEEILAKLIAYWDKHAKRTRLPTWSRFGQFLGHGSGISSAIVDRFRSRA